MKTVLAPNAPWPEITGWPKEKVKIVVIKKPKPRTKQEKITENFYKWLENNNLKENLQINVKRSKSV